ncbi:conserved hypothetical protein [Ricinus communis]|uniref:Uncharacterized protein n=1 Tax=Ricinus communis TaxID=3988 RepID=B9SL72_RICCO|nr:conserved hypothetical protein [Ricinus communis]
MERVALSRAVMVLLIAAVFSFATTSAQLASAPAPSMDTGAGFSSPVSTAVIGFSLVLSFLAFLKNH